MGTPNRPDSGPRPEIHENILACIGDTPLVRLHAVTEGIRTQVLAKCEQLNPGASVKDRIGLSIIEEAERAGRLKPGGTVVEATSGNTGVGLAIAAAIRKYRCVFTIPDKMSLEKVKLLKAFGAEVIVTPTVPPDHPEYYVTVGRRLAESRPNSIFADQFYNPVNPEAHYRTTGPELWRQTAGRITAVVGGMGTGGTMTGTARYLKERDPKIRIIGADPVGSIFKHVQETGQVVPGQPYKVEGIGGDKIPKTLDLKLIDEIRTVSDKDAFLMTRRLAREEGLFVGGSSGLATFIALAIAREIDDPDATVVVFLTDTGERYLSKVHSDEWMTENRFLEPRGVVVEELVRKKQPDFRLVFTTPERTVKQVLSLMHQNNISQVPIIEGGESRGAVKEGSLMARVIESPAAFDRAVMHYADPPFPVVNEGDPVEHIIRLFTRDNEAVLVRSHGVINGILTRFDIISHLSGR
jgi:cystathionine beta-synthase